MKNIHKCMWSATIKMADSYLQIFYPETQLGCIFFTLALTVQKGQSGNV